MLIIKTTCVFSNYLPVHQFRANQKLTINYILYKIIEIEKQLSEVA